MRSPDNTRNGEQAFMRKTIASSIAALIAVSGAHAAQGPVPDGIPPLDHVFVIMMENHAFGQIANNPQAPFINSLMSKANLAANYYAIAHPSSTNYLEVVGGSNFNKLSDQYPDWHDASCIPNIVPGQPTNTDNPNSGVFCPISGKDGTDAAIPALDNSMNETSTPPLTNINGSLSIPAGTKIDGISIADQLVWAGKSWKSYQEGATASIRSAATTPTESMSPRILLRSRLPGTPSALRTWSTSMR